MIITINLELIHQISIRQGRSFPRTSWCCSVKLRCTPFLSPPLISPQASPFPSDFLNCIPPLTEMFSPVHPDLPSSRHQIPIISLQNISRGPLRYISSPKNHGCSLRFPKGLKGKCLPAESHLPLSCLLFLSLVSPLQSCLSKWCHFSGL